MENEKSRIRNGTAVVVVAVTDESHVALAQWEAMVLARSAGLSQVAVYSIATSVSELADNLLFHTCNGGTITIRTVRQNGRVGVEVVAEDEGPGIVNLELAMQEGFSTNGGLGGGLPGVKRLMDEFEIESQVGAGTRVVARAWKSMQNV